MQRADEMFEWSEIEVDSDDESEEDYFQNLYEEEQEHLLEGNMGDI